MRFWILGLLFILSMVSCSITDKLENHGENPQNETADSAGPDIQISSPVPGTLFKGDLIVAGTANDPSGIQQVYVKMGGGNYKMAAGGESWYYIFHNYTNLNANQDIEIKALDRMGNGSSVFITLYFAATNILIQTNSLILTNYQNETLTNYTLLTNQFYFTNNFDLVMTNYYYCTNNYFLTNYFNFTNQIIETNNYILTNTYNSTNVIMVTNLVLVTNINYNYGDFLSQALDVSTLPFTLGGTGVWSITNEYYYGVSSVRTAPITHSQLSYIQTSTTNNFVSFFWKVSSEANYDYLSFYIDGVLKARISGSVNWTQTNFNMTIGSHILKWEYSKDSSGNIGSDCGWIDRLVLTNLSDSTPPVQTVSSPVNNQNYMITCPVTLNVSDNISLEGIYLAIDNSNSYSKIYNYVGLVTSAAYNSNYTLSAGAHTLYLFTKDASGNTSQTNQINVMVFSDTAAPLQTINTPTNNQSFIESCNLSLNVTDNVALDGIYMAIDDENYTKVKSFTTGIASSSFVSNMVLVTGEHTIKIFTKDTSSNYSLTNSTLITILPYAYYPPMAEWLFNNNANDTSGNLIHGTVSGAIITNDRFGNVDSSYYFNGSNTITITNDARLSMVGLFKEVTFSAWIKPLEYPADANHGKPIVSKMIVYNSTGYEYGLTLLNSRCLRLGSYYSYIESSPISLSNWYHVVAVMNNNSKTSKLYVNGVLQSSSLINYKNSENTVPVYIGKVPFIDGSADYFTGMIDDVQFYNYELRMNEITNLYHSNGW